jgi:hypothetical protein
MKKNLISLALVCAMVFALGATALADTTLTEPGTGDTQVTYPVDAKYTVTIPAAVTLSTSEAKRTISATEVLLEAGKKIVVTLSGASNTGNGESTFNAENGDTSVAKYTIKTGETDIAVGDKVAEFTANGDQTLTFTLGETTGVTVAGDHTETLTFTIAVEDNSPTPLTMTIWGDSKFNYANYYIEYTEGQTWGDMVDKYDWLEENTDGNVYGGPKGTEVYTGGRYNGTPVKTTDTISDTSYFWHVTEF